MGEILKISDSYTRVARLYPGVIAAVPVVWTVALAAPKLLEFSIASTTVLALLGAAVLYALASIARSRGKILEPKLLESWGGWPTTAMLRYRNDTLDAYTKARYRAALKNLCPTLPWPTEDDERREPAEADMVYRSATLALIEQRRDPKYKLLHRENASYGFRRNLHGLKPIGIAIILVCALAIGGAWQLWPGTVSIDTLALIGVVDIAMLAFWLAVAKRSYVRQAAVEYGLALFRTLDEAGPTP
ncbi:MAG: hypothetical protein JNK21_16545 [Rhodospirillaceae bacterium]|nr:hypothetical protein [Rhodospirillaceae bacterium]